MKGRLLDFSIQENLGIISGDDGNRYSFAGSEWRATGTPSTGMVVDFEARGSEAVAVYLDSASAAEADSKSKVVAGVLAILIGGLGIHKFYLNYRDQGLALLGATAVGFVLSFVGTGFVILVAIAVCCLVEGIIYLTKSDEEFYQTYIIGKKTWF